MIQGFIRTLAAAAVVAAFAGSAAAQDSKVADELAKYREALAEQRIVGVHGVRRGVGLDTLRSALLPR